MSKVNQMEVFGVAKSKAVTKKLRDIVREDLGDVTSEEYEAFLAFEETMTQKLIECSGITRPERKAEFEHFIKVAQSYHINCTALLLLGTYKKLRPDASPEERDTLNFITWMCEWMGAVMFVLDDIIEGGETRATQRTLVRQLGEGTTLRLAILTENLLHGMAAERLADLPVGSALLRKFYKYTRTIMMAEIIDCSSVQYDKLLDVKWHHLRKYTGSVVPMALFPTDLAHCFANLATDSEVVQYTDELSWLFGSYTRDLDDIIDLEEDTRNGSLNWGHMAAWHKANPKQREILMKTNSYPLGNDALEPIMKVYQDLNIKTDFRLYQKQVTAKFENLLKECPEEVGVKTWKACWGYISKLYAKASECV